MKFEIENSELADVLRAVCHIASREGGFALVVGGCVRDSLLGRPLKDVDIECYGIQPELLKKRLASRFRLDLVGESFGVMKLHTMPVDISIPRRESKSGLGHRGFDMLSDP